MGYSTLQGSRPHLFFFSGAGAGAAAASALTAGLTFSWSTTAGVCAATGCCVACIANHGQLPQATPPSPPPPSAQLPNRFAWKRVIFGTQAESAEQRQLCVCVFLSIATAPKETRHATRRARATSTSCESDTMGGRGVCVCVHSHPRVRTTSDTLECD